jgi:hypothetical protein
MKLAQEATDTGRVIYFGRLTMGAFLVIAILYKLNAPIWMVATVGAVVFLMALWTLFLFMLQVYHVIRNFFQNEPLPSNCPSRLFSVR